MAATATLQRPAPPAVQEAVGGRPLLPLVVARGSMFLALALVGSLHWMAMLEPAATARAWYAVGAGALAMLGLLAAGRLPGRQRQAGAVATGLIGGALALLAGGLADEMLRPDNWGAMMSGVGRGIDALPGARVPYRGVDDWTRLVIALGGTVLVVLAAVVAFWPRSRGRLGYPGVALVLLVTLYAVPAVALDFSGEFLRGALLTLLVIGFLRLERLRRREAAAAAGLALAAAVGALILAPALDAGEPWWDYETWALSTAASKSTAFSWDHDYGPLDWPRDGREMIRVKARQQAYWKAENLDEFDGRRWEENPFMAARAEPGEVQLPGDVAQIRRWSQDIRVTVRNLRSRTFVTAGVATGIDSERAQAMPLGGIFGAGRTLRRGDAYTARVYTPSPSEAQLRDAGTGFEAWQRPYLVIELPTPAAGDPLEDAKRLVSFPAYGEKGIDGEPAVPMQRLTGSTDPEAPGEAVLEASALSRVWALATRLREETGTPFAYVRAVERYLAGPDFTYTEAPPRSAESLPGFLFDARTGFCQQYSGAMALLLRMGGIPARVATGFTAGSFDRKAREWVVRDLDAHSWVEVWFPGYGWVTRDPTPAAAPPRSRQADAGSEANQLNRPPEFGGRRGADPTSRNTLDTSDPTPWWEIALLAAAAVLASVLLVVAARRHRARRPPPALRSVFELERALRRARRPATPATTLSALEARFRSSPAASGYVRALRESRYGGRAAVPTRAQRRGLRAELARGAGLRGRLRAWWALPPRPRRRAP
jgi:transglutaminase-like putative cysteine protease